LQPGQQFGARYRIIKLKGAGGMGAVYHAWDAELSVPVALKVIRPETLTDATVAADIERRFKRELLLAREVTHRNVVRIHDLGDVDGTKYLSMSYVEGQDLASILRRDGKLTVARALMIARQVAAGLEAAHAAKVIHRDLKPANVLMAGERALITDFGIARFGATSPPPTPEPRDARPVELVQAQTAATVMTPAVPSSTVTAPAIRSSSAPGSAIASPDDPTIDGTVGIAGTIEYMAPEQARGEAVDERADIYSFGLMLYDMLVGLQRHRSDTSLIELAKRMNAPPIPIRALEPGIPEPLDRIIMRCLEPDATKRFEKMPELTAALNALDDEGFEKPIVRTATRRQLIGWTATAATTALAVAGLAWWLAPPPEAPAERPPTSVLIADFENRTGEEVFGGALEQGLSVGIEGASFINSYARPNALRLATANGLGTTLNEATARLLARREGIGVVLAGSIDRYRNGYNVSVTAIDPAADTAIATFTASADDKDAVLAAVNELAGRVREQLGDTTLEGGRIAAAETFTAASLDAVREYALAQDLAANGRNADAIRHYERAIQFDPNFGRAYSGWASSGRRLGRAQEAEAMWQKALTLMDRMTEREKFRTLGTYYLGVSRNYDKAIENYTEVLRRWPADSVATTNLAYAYFFALDFPNAAKIGRQAVDLDPGNVTARNNLALFAMYASDFDGSVSEANRVIELNQTFEKPYLVLAASAMSRGDLAAVRDAYGRMAATGPAGATLATAGHADLALFEGRTDEAIKTLQAGMAEDARTGNATAEAAKHVALIEAYAAQSRVRAIAEAQGVVAKNRQPSVVVPAALALVDAGRAGEAAAVAEQLEQALQPSTRAWAAVIRARIALAEKRTVDAVEALRAALKLADLWLIRFTLARAYLDAGQHAEALADFELCLKRRGEAMSLFFEDVPTFRYLAPLPYWIARAQEGVGMTAQAVQNYDTFLTTRSAAPNDALVVDARRRLQQARK
jgi:serine/threonine protein kinase/tetratricopeptide (TPR) repeat protein